MRVPPVALLPEGEAGELQRREAGEGGCRTRLPPGAGLFSIFRSAARHLRLRPPERPEQFQPRHPSTPFFASRPSPET